MEDLHESVRYTFCAADDAIVLVYRIDGGVDGLFSKRPLQVNIMDY